MKRKRFFMLIILIFLLVACSDNEKQNNTSFKDFKVKNTETSINKTKPADYNNIFIYGTDAGTYFHTLYKLNKYKEMLKITYSRSLKKHGKEKILNFYKEKLNFAYKLGKLIGVEKLKDNKYNLIYISNIDATRVKTEIVTTVENDSIKIVLSDDLSNFPAITKNNI